MLIELKWTLLLMRTKSPLRLIRLRRPRVVPGFPWKRGPTDSQIKDLTFSFHQIRPCFVSRGSALFLLPPSDSSFAFGK